VGGGAEAKGEVDSPPSREPHVGLDPGTLDHDLSRRQILDRLSHPGILSSRSISIFLFFA